MREPAAWVLLGAVAVQMLAGLIYVFGSAAGYGGSPIPANVVSQRETFLGPVTVAMVLAAVALVLTAREKSPRVFGVVLTALILLGVGAVFGIITLIMGFVANVSVIANGFGDFFRTGAQLGVLAFAGLVLVRVFGDQNLVPRVPQQAAGPYGQSGPQPGYAPPTGAQPSFAQPSPNQTGQGYTLGAQGYQQPQDWSAQQQPYGDPNQTGAGRQGWPQEGYAQPSGAQQPYPAQQPEGAADPAAQQGQTGYSTTGGQQPYGQQYGQAAGYGQTGGQQPQDWSSASPAESAQQPYGQPQQPPYAGQPGYSETGAQQAGYGYGSATPGYGASGEQAGYGESPYAGQQSGGSDAGVPGYGSADSEATMVQQPVAGNTGAFPTEPPAAQHSERAAQDAIQYGWYQQGSGGQAQGDQGDSEATMRVEPGYGAQYGAPGSYPGQPHETPGTYGGDQQRRAGSEHDERPQGWYRDDDRR
ncbi:hypothetical protein [Marinitenerispora sediminis]|uniref:hypothetical protein n=1 Tax=Marinitenerispora sediminis TaxID=1931232 RepID=UPI0011C031F3|nr:hypothetical protein [Marinitenerispora sediminis]